MRRKPAKTPGKKKTSTPKPRPMKKSVARKKAPTAGKTRPSPTVKTEKRFIAPKQKPPTKTAQGKRASVARKPRSSTTAKAGTKQTHRSANTGKGQKK